MPCMADVHRKGCGNRREVGEADENAVDGADGERAQEHQDEAREHHRA